MSVIHSLSRACLAAIGCAAITACAPSAYVVKPPVPSGMKYESIAARPKTQLSIIDERRVEDRTFSSGVLKAELKIDKTAIDAMPFLAGHLQAELVSRGLDVATGTTDGGIPRIRVKTFRIQNHRPNGFAPFDTFTYLSADLESGSGTKRIAAYIQRGKVPVWSFDEVVEPTLNQPLSLVVKEFASKVANTLFGHRASDNVVKDLVAKIATRNELSYLDVYALGFTNNPTAIDPISKLLDDPDQYIRLAAISSLGNLGAVSHMARLVSIYQGPGSWHDRAMAIKAIADLGTAESKAFVSGEIKRLGGKTDNDTILMTQVIALYL
jgi:hypothetical protein